jgi:hypothetical protein
MPSVLVVLLLLWVVTAVHEAGHALAVRLKAGQVEALVIGRGPAFRSVLPGGMRVALGILPVGGKLVYRGVPTGTGHAVVALAGPAANLLLASLLLGSTGWAGEWFWLVPGSVLEILADGRAIGLLNGMRIIGGALASGTGAELAFALGALSAVWAGLNLLPIPGVGSDGWAVVSSLAAAIRRERGTSSPSGGPPEESPEAPDRKPGASERREVT